MGQPVFYLLAGPNGAGKSTLYHALVLAGTIPATAEFVNADLHEAARLQHVADPEQRSEQAASGPMRAGPRCCKRANRS